MADQYQPDGIPFLRSQDIQPFFINTQSIKFIDENFNSKLRKSTLLTDDVVIVRTGYPGTAAVVPPELDGANCADLVILTPGPQLDSWFTASLLNSTWGRSAVAGNLVGVAQQHFNVGAAKALRCRIPDLPVQRRIGQIIRAYCDLIEVNTRRIAILKEIADRLFHEWFVKFRFPGHTTTTFVETAKARTPAEWSRRTLSDLIELRYGKALKADQRVPGPFPVYGSSGVVGWHNNYLVEGPGIVVGRKGNVGSVHWSREAFYPIDTVFYVSTSWPKTFVFHVLQSQQFLNSDSAVPGLNRDQALRSSINLPPIALAIEFHRHANEYFQFMAKLGDINKNLRAARDLLLPRLISGEIDLAASDRVVERISDQAAAE